MGQQLQAKTPIQRGQNRRFVHKTGFSHKQALYPHETWLSRLSCWFFADEIIMRSDRSFPGVFAYRTELSRSAIRVCQPGPVAFQRSITSTGNLMESSLRGFVEMGRPPRLTWARASITSSISGRSPYSSGFTTWASTRAKSDFKERCDAGLFAFNGFSHAEYVAIRATRRVSRNDHPTIRPASQP